MLRSSWPEDNATTSSANYTWSMSPRGVLFDVLIIIVPITGNVRECMQTFAIWPQKNCNKETTPTNSFACEIPVRGSFSQFYFSL